MITAAEATRRAKEAREVALQQEILRKAAERKRNEEFKKSLTTTCVTDYLKEISKVVERAAAEGSFSVTVQAPMHDENGQIIAVHTVDRLRTMGYVAILLSHDLIQSHGVHKCWAIEVRWSQ